MAANDADDKRRAVIREFVATRLRIAEIQRKALSKRYGDAPSGTTCSFCGSREEEVFVLIPGLDDAYVCDECVGALNELLENAKKN